MAYKFQIGKAKLSGSVELAQSLKVQSGGIQITGSVLLPDDSIQNEELEHSTIVVNGLTGTLGESITLDTDDVGEGSSNLYYTDTRARAAVSVTDVSGDGSLSYDSSTGVITYTGPSASEVRAHLSAGDGLVFADGQFAVSASIAGAGLAWNAGVLSVDTAEIAEGLSGSVEAIVADFVEGSDFITFNDASGTIGVDVNAFTGSARSVVSVTDAGGDGSLSYNASTGVITYTGPSASETRAHFSAVDAGGDGSFSYADGVFTYTGPSAAEARAHFSATDAGGDGSFSYDSASGVFTYTGPSSAEVQAHFSAGDGLDYSAGVFSIGAAEVTNAMLAGSIENAKLVNSSVTLNGTAGEVVVTDGASLALGGTATVSLPSTITKNLNFSGDVSINNLSVTGTLTYINTTNLVVEDALITIASGSALMAGIGIELGTDESLQTVMGDAVVGNALSSSLPLIAPSVKAASFYGNLVGSMQLTYEAVSTAVTISKNVTKVTANETVTLPALPQVGQEHRIKCGVAEGSNPAVVVAANAGQTIEGAASITLQSNGAAVSLVWDGAAWMIF